ncbi:MAG: hypothetical protein R3D46_04845 [Defluviimonas denitrificans]
MMLIDQALNAIFAFTKAPMRFCTLVGSGIAVMSILFSVFSVLAWFVGLGDAPRRTTTIIVALFFLSGCSCCSSGCWVNTSPRSTIRCVAGQA